MHTPNMSLLLSIIFLTVSWPLEEELVSNKPRESIRLLPGTLYFQDPWKLIYCPQTLHLWQAKWLISPKHFLNRCLLQATFIFYFILLLYKLLFSLPKPSITLYPNLLIYLYILICLYENFLDLLTGFPMKNLSTKCILLLSHIMQFINIFSVSRLNTAI